MVRLSIDVDYPCSEEWSKPRRLAPECEEYHATVLEDYVKLVGVLWVVSHQVKEDGRQRWKLKGDGG